MACSTNRALRKSGGGGGGIIWEGKIYREFYCDKTQSGMGLFNASTHNIAKASGEIEKDVVVNYKSI